MDRSFSWAADKRRFDSAMLIAERYFQVKNTLAVALEAKMAWLDDSRMYGTDGDLMDFISTDGKEFGRSRERSLSSDGPPIRWVEPDRLEPRMALRFDVPLLRNFALEPMRLRAIECQTRIGLAHLAAD